MQDEDDVEPGIARPTRGAAQEGEAPGREVLGAVDEAFDGPVADGNANLHAPKCRGQLGFQKVVKVCELTVLSPACLIRVKSSCVMYVS